MRLLKIAGMMLLMGGSAGAGEIRLQEATYEQGPNDRIVVSPPSVKKGEIKVTRDESVRIDFPEDTEIRTSWSAYWKFMTMSAMDAAKLRDALINAIGNAPCDDEKFQKVLDDLEKRKRR